LCFIPTLFSELAKFVHFIREKSPPFSPTFNHTHIRGPEGIIVALAEQLG
jgi:hypothetical protein